MKILYLFLYFWVIFALLDPDPATHINTDPCGSGSVCGWGIQIQIQEGLKCPPKKGKYEEIITFESFLLG
jgi:hypothetical protein